ncbi:beta-defensin 107, partial [Daubentonia madagascariensis]
RGAIHRRVLCQKLQGRCEAECLTFEDQIGGCRAELSPFCCKRKKS